MPYTTPKTWAVADVLTAADMNVYDRDNIAWLATDKPHCRVYNSGALSINDSTTTALTFNSERVDVGAMHDTSSTTSRLTIPTGGGGFYLFTVTIEFASNSTGYRQLLLRVNGTTSIASTAMTGLAGGGGTQLSLTTLYQMAAGDYAEACAIQTSGGALNVTVTANQSPEFSACWMAT